MNAAFSNFISDLWRDEPILIVLAVVASIVFILLVIDTYRHRKKQKDRHPKEH